MINHQLALRMAKAHLQAKKDAKEKFENAKLCDWQDYYFEEHVVMNEWKWSRKPLAESKAKMAELRERREILKEKYGIPYPKSPFR